MKLIYRIIYRISLAMVLILAVWAVLFYFAIMGVVNDEVDDQLDDYSEQIMIKALSGEELPAVSNGTNNQYYLEEISAVEALSQPQISYADEEVFIVWLDETEPARLRHTIFKNMEDRYFKLTVATPTFEKEDIREAILYWIVILFCCLVVAVVAINSFVFYRSMRPLYVFLKWLDNYRIGQKNSPLNNPTKITEFRRLNEVGVRTMERNERLYEQQREFTGNASHELQTPLAISINRVEMLMEDETLTPEQLEALAKIHHSLGNIVKLSKSMLLLSRIENGQFPDTTNVSFSRIVDNVLDDYKAIYSYKDIQVEVVRDGDFECKINEQLASMLVTNLLKNAFVHTEEGTIRISISAGQFAVSNGPSDEALDGESIFHRFNQGKKRKNESTGLGLTIVRSICEQFGLTVNYSFVDSYHTFRIAKNR